MKKIPFFLTLSFFAILTLGSCNSSEDVTNAAPEVIVPESAKSPEVVAFRAAFVASIIAKSKMQNGAGRGIAKANAEAELTIASKKFLEVSGVLDTELKRQEVQDPAEMRRMAIALFAKKTAIQINN